MIQNGFSDLTIINIERYLSNKIVDNDILLTLINNWVILK